MPSRTKIYVVAVLLGRIAYGAGLAAVPERLSKRWLGPLADPTSVALRALGVREAVLHALALGSALRGGPVRPFLLASAVGDLADIVTTVGARKGLPAWSAPATVLVAGASAAESVYLATRANR
ncbi:MAG: hypothetical protein ACR2IP_11440 [Solirubrobacteraceae bacterium]